MTTATGGRVGALGNSAEPETEPAKPAGRLLGAITGLSPGREPDLGYPSHRPSLLGGLTPSHFRYIFALGQGGGHERGQVAAHCSSHRKYPRTTGCLAGRCGRAGGGSAQTEATRAGARRHPDSALQLPHRGLPAEARGAGRKRTSAGSGGSFCSTRSGIRPRWASRRSSSSSRRWR